MPRHIFQPVEVALGRGGSRINTDGFSKWAPKAQAMGGSVAYRRQLGERGSAELKVAGSNAGRTNNRGL